MDKRASLNSIPVLNPEEQHRHHFGHNRVWEKQLESGFHQFHINRIEEAKELIRFPLPRWKPCLSPSPGIKAGSSSWEMPRMPPSHNWVLALRWPSKMRWYWPNCCKLTNHWKAS
jgi:hypothetical protein